MTDIADRITRFLVETYPPLRERGIAPEEALLGSDLIDSVGLVELLAFLEQEFLLEVPDEDLVPVHFQSINALARYIASRQSSSPAETSP